MTKRNIDISHKNAIAKLKQSKSEAESVKEVKLVIKSIFISTLEFNIPTNLNNIVSLNQTAVIVTSLSLDLTTNMCPTICKDENRLYQVMLKIFCIFMNVYDKSQANNIFH